MKRLDAIITQENGDFQTGQVNTADADKYTCPTLARKHRVGEEIQVEFLRDGKPKTAKLVLEQTPENY